jgi:hypothetical protein
MANKDVFNYYWWVKGETVPRISDRKVTKEYLYDRRSFFPEMNFEVVSESVEPVDEETILDGIYHPEFVSQLPPSVSQRIRIFGRGCPL